MARITAPIKQLAMRGTIYTSFIFAKQPKRIRQVRCCAMPSERSACHSSTAVSHDECIHASALAFLQPLEMPLFSHVDNSQRMQ